MQAIAPRKLRILHCLRAPVGGLFRHVRDLARAQAERGHEVGVICDAATGDALTNVRLAALTPSLALGLVRTPMSRDVGPADVGATLRTRAVARVLAVDVLHGHGAKGGAYARLAARALTRRGQPIVAVYTPHGGSLHYDPASLVGRAYMAAERALARISDAIVFESAYSARVFATKVAVPPCPAPVVHNGLLPDELVPVAPAADAADLLFVGELRVLKGVDLLLEAIAMLAPSRPCTALIVGAGPDGAAFRARAAALGIADRVTFAGPMPAREAFRRGRVLVMPSRAESFPYVALEGAAAGLPLVASDVGGLNEIVCGTDTPLVPAEDAAALAAAIDAVLANPTLARARASRLGEAVARRFTVDAMADAVLDIYAGALGMSLCPQPARPAPAPASAVDA